jgi:lysozyme
MSLQGIDVFGGNAPVDWYKVKNAGISFAWVKATEGVSFTENPSGFFESCRAGAAAAGIPIGAYHFARPDLGNAPVKEATFFCDKVKSVQDNELRPILDIEKGAPSSAWCATWLVEVERRLGVRPAFYTYVSFLNYFAGSATMKQWPLWLAYYGQTDDGTLHTPPDTGYRVIAQQYTSKGAVDGVTGDTDRSVADSLNALREHEDYRLWRDWRFTGGASLTKPVGLPGQRPSRWKDSLNADSFSFAAQSVTLQNELDAANAALAAADLKIDKAREDLA